MRGDEACCPVNDGRNNALYARCAREAEGIPNLIPGGRPGLCRCGDMDRTGETL